jgi:probable addiction module antidote protein
MKTVRSNNYEIRLLEALKDPEEALAYLNAALIDEDKRVFLLALKHVLMAQGIDISAFAEESHVTRQNVYRMLSEKGNPRWSNLCSIVNAMGLQVKLESKNK